MAKSQSGLEDLTWADLDSALAMTATFFTGTTEIDLFDATYSLLPDTVMLNFAASVAASGVDSRVYAVFAEATGEYSAEESEAKKVLVASLVSAGTFTDSNVYSVPVLARWMRLAYDNVQAITLTSRIASSFQGSYSP